MREAKGALIISIDYEFAWGFADFDLAADMKARMQSEVAITRRLLGLFERYDIPATWAVVGHLLERECPWEGELVHPEYPRPIHRGECRDWFMLHPPESEYSDVLWFDAEHLIPEIAQSRVGHEVASHSYAHIIYGARGVSEAAVQADVRNLIRVHNDRGYPCTSFVFPRNFEGYHEVLKEAGFQCYRGNTKGWYSFFPGLRRALRLIDYYLPIARTVLPRTGRGGLINIPDSLLLLGRNGLRRLVLPGVMQWKIKRGIKAAARRGEMFHLWFHPSNFWHDTDTQFSILEDALKYAAALRSEGKLSVCTMRDVCSRA